MFADYEPGKRVGPLPEGFATRPMARDDVPALAAIRVERGDAKPEEAAKAFEWLLGRVASGDATMIVATVRDAVAGYGSVDRLAREGIPEGWYLGGVVVSPPWRRRGIGARLTRERLDWVAARAERAYYFVNAQNRASIDLHAPFGFRPIVHGVVVPGVTFRGGVGILFAADLPRGSRQDERSTSATR
jgi:GNAT superfamily N-acetyltransferase